MKQNYSLLVTLITILFLSFTANAKNRTQIQNGVYLVTYGNTAVIEDEINHRTISMVISQEISDRKTNEKVYKVVCGKYTRRVAQWALHEAIKAGYQAAVGTGGSSLTVSAIALAADLAYEMACEYFEP